MLGKTARQANLFVFLIGSINFALAQGEGKFAASDPSVIAHAVASAKDERQLSAFALRLAHAGAYDWDHPEGVAERVADIGDHLVEIGDGLVSRYRG